MAGFPTLREGETAVDEALGYPRAYAKLCKSSSIYSGGPPHEFQPYALQHLETVKSEEFDKLFPVLPDPERISAADLEPYADLLWKKLTHLANAGFDPALFRVDPYGNVIFLHADESSALAWRIDHWFPRKRGGKSVLSNLRLVQSQVYKAKKNKLEFLVPWWDLQLGISVNQFLSVFASRNSDFRNRAFYFLFNGGEDQVLEELNIAVTPFPPKFLEKRRQIGLAAAAITPCKKYSDDSALKALSQKRQNWPLRPSSPSRGEIGEAMKSQIMSNRSKENENPNVCSEEYLSIAMARDSLREMEAAKRHQAEIKESLAEIEDLTERNEAERIKIQDLELELFRKRRRVEKCRRLAEAQASYRSQLERMIRDAMHQFVVYKEQARLNQAACNALTARLETQRAMRDTSEEELLRKFKMREELEVQSAEQQSRKRSWEQHEEEQEDLQCGEESIGVEHRRKMRKALRKELRVFLEEEQKASEAGMSLDEDLYMERCSDEDDDEPEEVEERSSEMGKKNVEKWLDILLKKAENTVEREDEEREDRRAERRVMIARPDTLRSSRASVPSSPPVMIARPDTPRSSRASVPPSPLNAKRGAESPRSSRVSFPSSPLILKKGIDCILKKTRRI